MSTITRKGLEFIVNQIGKAKFAYKDLVGDTTYVRGFYQDFEKNLLKIKGSNTFHDYDLSKKDPNDIDPSNFTTFDAGDNISFGIQGGKLIVDSKISSFKNLGSWTPQNYNPPTPEGWFIYDYNAWSNYIPPYNASNNPNTGYVIYTFPSITEPNSGSGRTSFEYPVRYDGTSYSRVSLFESSRWISVKNYSGSTKDECRITIPKSVFGGLKNINPLNNKPVDIGIYSHRFLISDNIDSTMSLSGSMGIIGTSDVLTRLGFNVQETSSTGSTTDKVRDYWTFDVNLPASSTWSNNYWLHLGFYWSTHDTNFLSGYPTYSAGSATTFNGTNLDSQWYIFPKKTYFVKNVSNFVSFEKTGVNDTNVYLYSKNKSNNVFTDQRYSSPTSSLRYLLNEDLINSSTGSTNSFQNMISIEIDEFVPVILATSNKGFNYDNPNLDIEIFYGSPVPFNHAPEDWSEFDYYPSIDDKYDILFKVILSNPGNVLNQVSVDNLNGTYSKNQSSIVYFEEVCKNSISPNINDGSVIRFFLPAELRYSTFVRNGKYDKIFETLGLKLIPGALRFDTTKIKDLDSFGTNSDKAHKSIHNLAKNPMDTLLLNEEEPVAIQFSNQGSDVIKSFTTEETSQIFAEFNSNDTSFNNLVLKNNAEFEVYQPKTSTELHNNKSGTKLERDYAFRIKFKDIDSNYYLKDIFVNASKYLLTDEEYADRQSKNLSLNGYFKKSDLTNIEDYRLYGYSAVIPDIESSQGRTIDMKVAAPEDSTRISEADFEANLLVVNPSLTAEQISQTKAGFLLTSTFYSADSTKFSNKFVEITDLGISVTNYLDNLNPSWINNTNGLIGSTNSSLFDKPKHIKDLRADSFIISGSGYTFSDNTINQLENIYDQAIKANDNSINQNTHVGNKELEYQKVGIRINPSENIYVKSFKIKLKKISEYRNPDANIVAEIWSAKDALPYEKLSVGTSISLDSVNSIFQEKEFFINYNLFKDKEYWIVLNSNNLPPKYDLNVGGLISINNNSITGVYNQKSNSYTAFDKYNLGVKVGIGTDVPTNVNTWYTVSSIGSSNSMTVSGAGITLSKQAYSIKYDYLIGIEESSAVGASTNMAYYSGTAWSADNGTAFINFYTNESEIYGAFNRDFDSSTIVLPSSNKYRESKPQYFANESWSFKIDSLDEEKLLYIYPRSITTKQNILTANGTSGQNYVSVGQTDFSEKVLGGMLITHSSIPAGTAISYIYHDVSNSNYKLFLTKNLSSNISDDEVYVGITTSLVARRTKDIHCAIRYYENGGLATTSYKLEKSPSWITYWNKSNRYNYNVVDKNTQVDLISATYNLNFENYQPLDQIKYVNGFSIGEFTPKAALGTTFDFRFTSSYGLKVFVDNSTSPSIDKWKNTSGVGYTFSKTLSVASQPIKLEVQFYNLSSSIGQTLKAEWRVSGTSAWSDLDDSFYEDAVPEIKLISSENIQRISYISVGSTSDVAHSPYFGSPQTDMLVLRSK